MWRGRGRGGFRGGRGYAKEEPIQLFPNFVLPGTKDIPEDKNKAIWNAKLKNYINSSPYYIQDSSFQQKNESIDMERFSDWGKQNKTKSRRNTLDQFILLNSNTFPTDLIGDSRRVQQNPKRVRWNNTDSDLKKLEDLEKKIEGKEEDGDKAEDDDEEEEVGDRTDEEFSDDGDYNQNRDFDDDEDDYNADNGDEDEAVY